MYKSSNKDIFNVVFPPAFRVAQLNRVGQSDSFTFVTHSTVRRNKGSMLQEGNCFGIQDSAMWLSSKYSACGTH